MDTRQIANPTRLAIALELARHSGQRDFLDVRRGLGIELHNELKHHCTMLAKAGAISFKRIGEGRHHRDVMAITPAGRKALAEIRDAIVAVIGNADREVEAAE